MDWFVYSIYGIIMHNHVSVSLQMYTHFTDLYFNNVYLCLHDNLEQRLYEIWIKEAIVNVLEPSSKREKTFGNLQDVVRKD